MQGAGTYMARDAGVRARPWDREKFSNVGRREAKLKPTTRLPAYLADPSQNRWDSDSGQWAPASSQVGAHYGGGAASAPAGGRVAAMRRAEVVGQAGYARGDHDNVWQRSSDAFGDHYADALGPVDLGAERIKHHKEQGREVGDTLRWAPRANSKTAALARFHADQAAQEGIGGGGSGGDGGSFFCGGGDDGGRHDRESRTHAPNRRRI
eukprot:6884024-Prymnesium_polylepis.1